MDDRVFVVGGGLAGLAAAAMLARDGVPVTVLERRRAPGGRGATLDVDGFALTEGAHALYLAGAGMRVLRDLGIDPPGGVPDAAGGRVLRGAALHPSPYGAAALLRSPLLGLRERAAAARALGTLGLRRPGAGAGRSAEAWLAQEPGPPRVRELLRALTRLVTYAGDLEALPAEVALLQLRLSVRGDVRYLDGGWGALVRALRSTAEAAGAEVRCGATVEAVGADRSVRLAGGETLRGRAVVLAGLAPEAVARLTGVPVAPPGPPVEAACLDVALAGLPRPAHAWTLGLDEPLYVSAYSQWSRIAPPGGAVVHVVRHLRAGERAGREELEEALDRVQPGWRERLVHANFLPRMTVVHAAPTPAAGLAGRPGADALGRPGVLVAGDWVGPDGWLADAALASAAAAARAAASVPAPARAPVAA